MMASPDGHRPEAGSASAQHASCKGNGEGRDVILDRLDNRRWQLRTSP